jgi:hypothetical protein
MKRFHPFLLCALLAAPLPRAGAVRFDFLCRSRTAPGAAHGACRALVFDFDAVRTGWGGTDGQAEITLGPGAAAVILRVNADSLSGRVVHGMVGGFAALACGFARALEVR